MSAKTVPIPLDSPAYRLFIEELERHLCAAELQLNPQSPLVSNDQARKLSASFHTIRGSAGFFGLASIAQTAQALEEHLGAVAEGADLDQSTTTANLSHLINLKNSLPRG